jgi:3',5'-nucleoside bisphosphate phosphatase
MEVCNNNDYYPDAHRWCLEKNLTMLGNSDIHEPDLRKRSTADDHRTLTLVFARQRTPAALKEALQEGRTAVWFKEQVIGREQFLRPLLAACVQILPPVVRGKNAWVPLRNSCEADLMLSNTGKLGPEKLQLPAGTTTLVKLPASKDSQPLELKYTVSNFLIAPETGLSLVLTVPQP